MSDLFTPSYSTKCQGWTNPNNIFFGPKIAGLSSFYSPAGATVLVSINGANFYSYSSVSFGTYNPTVYFINSNILQFYVPPTLNPGTYTVQVFNGSFASNIVNYTINNASGYWLLQPNGSITNTNTSGTGNVNVNSLSRGTPVNIIEDNSPYTIPNNVNWIICYYYQHITTTGIILILPTGSDYAGREIMIKTVPNNTLTAPHVVSYHTNIIPINGIGSNFGSTATTNILSIPTSPNQCGWCTLVYDGTYWVTMQSAYL